MNALTDMANVLSLKDEAITEAIELLSTKIIGCDIGSGDDAECYRDKTNRDMHWYWCKNGKAGRVLRNLHEALKAR